MSSSYKFDENATYVIAGGLGGLGRSIARWIARRNARHIMLLSRSGAESKAAQLLLDELTAMRVNVVALACDVSNLQILTTTLAECSKSMPLVKGCFQASMVLEVNTLIELNGSEVEAKTS